MKSASDTYIVVVSTDAIEEVGRISRAFRKRRGDRTDFLGRSNERSPASFAVQELKRRMMSGETAFKYN